MPWAKPEYKREQCNKAGESLVTPQASPQDYFEARETVNNWRAVHACPLQTIKMALRGRAINVNPAAIVSQRTKRIPAISLKLRENHAAGMERKLTQMHDIGVCRAVLRSVFQVEDLVAVYKKADLRSNISCRSHRTCSVSAS